MTGGWPANGVTTAGMGHHGFMVANAPVYNVSSGLMATATDLDVRGTDNDPAAVRRAAAPLGPTPTTPPDSCVPNSMPRRSESQRVTPTNEQMRSSTASLHASLQTAFGQTSNSSIHK